MAAGIGTLFLGAVCLYLLFVVVKFLYRVWWTPIWTQKVMAQQGIRGPRYRFLHGNLKEIMQMKKEAMATTMGLTNDIIQKVQPQFHRWINTYGKNFIFWQGPKAQVFVSEGELMKEILNNKEKTYPKQELAPYAQKLIGNSLVSFEGDIWSKMRKLANNAFHGESLKNLTPEMVASAEMMLERWKNHVEKEIEVFNEFKQLTSEVISRTAFGSSYVEGKDIFEKLGKVLMIAHRPPSKFKLSNIFRGSGGENEMQKLVSEMRNSILEIIRKREKKVMSGEAESYGKDFLGLLLQSCHDPDESQRITVENVIDECKGMYVAGQETTTNFLSWTIMLLAIHTDWQEEARKEVENMFGQQFPNPDGISKLKTMGMIINETLRLYPPAMGVIRKVNREVKLGKYRLPSNTNFYLPILKLHHDPKVWGEDAHLFKPERFAEGVAKATKNDVTAFCPFGIGPRTCVGSNFAITEAKITLSMILQRYSFTLSPAYVHSPVQVLLLRPQHGVQIILHPLNIYKALLGKKIHFEI